MPRQPRKKSESGIYHVMLRGINKQEIFNDKEDCEKFLWVLKETKAVSEYKLFAYCLMSNHVHLLIKPEKEPLEQIFKRICGKFVYWYNVKYERTGHLFQDRYKSETVDDEAYFLTVIRYIHQNPIKAKLCQRIEDYKYSSYHEYIGNKQIIDTGFIPDIMSKDEFVTFNCELNTDKCLEIEDKVINRLTDEQAQCIMELKSGCENATEFQRLLDSDKEKYLKNFKDTGMSIRQASRLTGVSVALVRKHYNT